MVNPRPDVAHERLVAGLTPGLRALAMRGTLRHYAKNAVVINEGEPGDTLFILVQGRVKLFSNDTSGKEITYDIVGQGDYFAEMWLDGGPRAESVMALEPCVCSVVGRDGLRDHLAEQPAFALELVSQVIGRARKAMQTARSMALLDVYGRVVATLEGEQGPGSAGAPVTLTKVTHQQIASRVGASREMVSRLLKDLEKGGYIRLGVKQITLLRKLPLRW